MKMFDNLAALMGYEKRSAPDPSWAAIASNIGYASALTAQGAEQLSAVLACTSAISSALASIPALVYRNEGTGRIEAENHPLRRLTRSGVSPDQTWPDFIEHTISSVLLTGNSLAEIKRDGRGSLVGLNFIPWHWATVSILRSGRLAYDVSNGQGKSWRLLENEVFHLKERTDDGYIGRSRLSRAAHTVEAVKASNDFGRMFLKNGAQPSGIIKSATPLSKEQLEEMRSQFSQGYEGEQRAGKTLILDGGLDWAAAQISPEDAELLETRKFGVEEICRLFQVPPPLVQDYSHNTFTNSETAGRWFAMFCLAPWARKIEAEFARSVFPVNGPFELELDLSGFLRGDPATRWQAHQIALTNNVLDADEVRQVEGWNPRKQPPDG